MTQIIEEPIQANAKELLEKACPLQVHRKTDYPPMNAQLSEIFSKLKQLRKEEKRQLRKADKVKKHLM
ncbi:hypothetical protein [Nitrosomonas sp.]|uniref:hypothetical protein n=1 Tax=Nitrosomonas sp. TaxID=42353 RepID=UPI002080BFF4|nr:hypothetical protein [Nitrosomonas sp.]GJL76887.1 MAG: hypothetical protein NMNS02_29930 [Nitrosomonas sp.]